MGILPRQLCGFIFLVVNLVLSLISFSLLNENFVGSIGELILRRNMSMELHEAQYCIGYNFLEATESFRLDNGLEPVTLATHATSDMLKNLENLPKTWNGPISVGIFVDIQSLGVLEYLSDLHRCDKDFNRKMTIHFAYRKSAFQKECPPIKPPISNRTCWKFRLRRKSLQKDIISPFLLYPYTLMRNVARIGAKSDLHFLMDADMIVSEGMAEKVKPIANEMIDGRNKNVLLVRRFESKWENDGVKIPRNPIELKEAVIENRTPYWEPQPILHRNDPYNPDYFPSRLRDMISLFYKLCRANYTFHVLSHVFNVHEGVKTSDTIFSKAVSAHQQIYAKEIAHIRFTKEMNDLYPDTVEKCGEFNL